MATIELVGSEGRNDAPRFLARRPMRRSWKSKPISDQQWDATMGHYLGMRLVRPMGRGEAGAC